MTFKNHKWKDKIEPIPNPEPTLLTVNNTVWTEIINKAYNDNIIFYDPKQYEMESIGKGEEYKLLRNLKKGETKKPTRRDWVGLTGITVV